MKNTLALITGLLISTSASAATWTVSGVEHGVDASGFGFSGLHDASGYNVMSGPELASIDAASGTYDDVTGEADFQFTLSNGDSLALVGNLLFNNMGWLAGHSTLAYTGLNLSGVTSSGEFGYMQGDVCCSGDFAPNSFQEVGTQDLNYLTLWGADGFNTQDGSYSNSSIGMDFRLALAPSAVPLPAAIWMFTPALLGIFGLRKKKPSVMAA